MDRRCVLVPVDLPVDMMVVLEQEERAYEAEGTERALGDGTVGRVGEHVFVRYDRLRTDRARTCVRVLGDA
jgi:hypothetical protein